MIAESILLKNFRNYLNLSLALSDGLNIFIGDNAQGKTNIAETLFLATVGKSHRTNEDRDFINLDNKECRIKIDFTKLSVKQSIELYFYRDKRKRILINGAPARQKELVGRFNAVMFSPEDMFLIKGAPALRRKFLDREISQADPTYYDNLVKFTRAVTQRNALLKDIREGKSMGSLLAEWDDRFVDYAAKVTAKRLTAVKKLDAIAEKMQGQISDNKEELRIKYGLTELNEISENITAEELGRIYAETLTKLRSKDIIRGSTSVGPQHDDLIFYINGEVLRSFGSQGQQRTSVLALKLAELEFLREETGEYPVLLLDDIMSELDGNRRNKLLNFLQEEKIQTCITATDPMYFRKNTGKAWQVSQGELTEITL